MLWLFRKKGENGQFNLNPAITDVFGENQQNLIDAYLVWILQSLDSENYSELDKEYTNLNEKTFKLDNEYFLVFREDDPYFLALYANALQLYNKKS